MNLHKETLHNHSAVVHGLQSNTNLLNQSRCTAKINTTCQMLKLHSFYLKKLNSVANSIHTVCTKCSF